MRRATISPCSNSIGLLIRRALLQNIFIPFLPNSSFLYSPCTFPAALPKVSVQDFPIGSLPRASSVSGYQGFHSSLFLERANYEADTLKKPESSSTSKDGSAKGKRKKLKGKRAVVRWLKHFRWKKKKELERMTAEETMLYKLNKAHKKEERLVEALKKLEPKEWSEATHDPEVLTPEEHFYFLKMGNLSTLQS